MSTFSIDGAIHSARRKYGFDGVGAAIDPAKFEKASLKAQMRFMRLWQVALARLKSLDYQQLQTEFAPLNGSLDAIQRPLITDMEEWFKCWIAISIAVHGQEARKEIAKTFWTPKPMTQEEIIREKRYRDQERSEQWMRR